MSVKYSVPFYENTHDDTHCVQACYKMILKYFFPEDDYSWEELDKASAKQKDMWTWPMAGLCWLQKRGFEIRCIENFDYAAFLEKKDKYLIELYGKAVASEQIKHSNIDAEIKWVKRFVKEIESENRAPKLSEIFDYLNKGYLVLAGVNYKSLHNQAGYVGHYVVVTGYTEHKIFLNDPGLPGIENWEITHEQFKKGWSYPDVSANNLIAIRLRENA